MNRILPAGEKKTKQLKPISIFKIVPEILLLVNMRPVEGEKCSYAPIAIAGKSATFSIISGKKQICKNTVCDVVGEPIVGNP